MTPPDIGLFSPRTLISASWRRATAAGIDPDATAAPLVYDVRDIGEARSSHPLRPLLPLLDQTLLRIADEAAHIMIVTDAEGHILWRDGHRDVLRRADTVGLADGFDWSETAFGTNGIGTALATGRPTSVYSDEHLVRVLHNWSCVGAPIIDPDSGSALGCVDISGTATTLPPATVALVGAAAQLAESELALRMRENDERLRSRHGGRLRSSMLLITPTGRVIGGERYVGRRLSLCRDRALLPTGETAPLEALGDAFLVLPKGCGRPRLSLTVLGTDHPFAELDGVRVALSLRHAEILTLLATHPRGLTADQLSFLMYGDRGNPVTVRAEIHRLRAQLGDAVAAKPYRLTAEVSGDFLAVTDALTTGDVATAVARYTGPLLPRSESPALRSDRAELDGRVRAAVLARGTLNDLWSFAQSPTGRDDHEVLQRLASALPTYDGRRTAARLRLTTID